MTYVDNLPPSASADTTTVLSKILVWPEPFGPYLTNSLQPQRQVTCYGQSTLFLLLTVSGHQTMYVYKTIRQLEAL